LSDSIMISIDDTCVHKNAIAMANVPNDAAKHLVIFVSVFGEILLNRSKCLTSSQVTVARACRVAFRVLRAPANRQDMKRPGTP
jgi:hypothetical protein